MVVILRGTSGSGKSRLAKLLSSLDFKIGPYEPISTLASNYIKSLWGKIIGSEHRGVLIVSADDYFSVDGDYKFDPKFLGAAHAASLRHFTEVVVDQRAVVVVDNTNCSLAEFVPYAALANAYGHELHIVTLVGDPVKNWERNKHQVPFNNVIKQDLILRQSIIDMPPWFPQQLFPE